MTKSPRHADDKTLQDIVDLRRKLAETERQLENCLSVVTKYYRMRTVVENVVEELNTVYEKSK